MKNAFYVLVLALLTSTRIFSQVEIPVFEKMSGNWLGYSKNNGELCKEFLDMKWTMNHNFFEINLSDDRTHSTLNYEPGKSKEVFTLSDGNDLTGWYIDNLGFKQMLNLTGTISENKITFTGKNKYAGCTIIYELNNKQLIRKSEWELPSGEIIRTDITYDNKKSDYETHFLPTIFDNISEPGLAYVCHLSEDFVTVFDTKTNVLKGKIPCGKNSDFICFSPDGYNGYITNFSSGNLTVFNRKTNETIATVDAGENPTFLLGLKDKVLISHQSQDGLWALDINSNVIVNKLRGGTGPLYLIENENKIYQPQIFIPYLFVINPKNLEIIKKIKTGGRPMEMAFTGNKKYGYMVNFDLNEVTKFDTKTDEVLKHLNNVSSPRGIAASPDGKLVYVTNVVDGKIYVINTETDVVTAAINGFKMPVSVAFTIDGKYAYVLNQAESSVSIIDTKENNIVQTFYVAGNPISILIDYK